MGEDGGGGGGYLHDEVWPESSHARDSNPRFRGSVCGADSCTVVSSPLCQYSHSVVYPYSQRSSRMLFRPIKAVSSLCLRLHQSQLRGGVEHTIPKNGANLGADSESAIVDADRDSWSVWYCCCCEMEADALEAGVDGVCTASQLVWEVEAIRVWR